MTVTASAIFNMSARSRHIDKQHGDRDRFGL
jgi:hypothetical protein